MGSMFQANASALEAETVSVETLRNLREQREQILKVKGNVKTVGQELNTGTQTVKRMDKRNNECNLM